MRGRDHIVELRPCRAVEMIGRFIQQHDLGSVKTPPCQHRLCPFAAAQRGCRGVEGYIAQSPFAQRGTTSLLDSPIVAQRIEIGRIDRARANRPQGPYFVGRTEQFGNAPPVGGRMLRDEIGTRRGDYAARQGSQPTCQQLKQRRFTRSVATYERHLRAIGHGETYVRKQRFAIGMAVRKTASDNTHDKRWLVCLRFLASA